MFHRRLLWQLYPSYLLITLLSIGGVTWYASHQFRDFYLRHTARDLEARAVLLREELLARGVFDRPQDPLPESVVRQGRDSGTRITVLDGTGRVIGDTEESPAALSDTRHQEEVVTALAGEDGQGQRPSADGTRQMLYVALPVLREGQLLGVVRTGLSISAIDTTLGAISRRIALCGLFVLVVTGGMALVISRSVSRPLEDLKHGAERFARGELGRRLAASSSEEIDGLAMAMNTMAEQLDHRIRATVQERNEKEAMLRSMAEGVLAIDQSERVLHLNHAAARFLHVDPVHAQGRLVLEVVRNPGLHEFIEETLKSTDPVERDLTLHNEGKELYVFAHGTTLRSAEGNAIGALVVLNDVTELHRLENIRRDFVANVSHELRTPITTIKGFAEMLLDGALENPEDAERFLGTIVRQADRLSAITDDLLSLSRIEREEEKSEIILSPNPLHPVLESAVQTCLIRAQRKSIALMLECAPHLEAVINSQLLEQAIINLIANAIEYSGEGTQIEVGAQETGDGVRLYVADQGCGIPAAHLPRIFERFYRVDKARSRKVGGTGLGLAIVKHIALAHGGRVDVDSEPGVGSTFSIILPFHDHAANA